MRPPPETRIPGTRYRLGWNLFHLAQAADPDHHLRTAARPHLLRLREQTTGSIYLRVIRDGMNLIIDTLESSHPLRLVQPPGNTRPAHFGASGKVLLAFGPAWLREAVVAVPRLKGFTSRTIVDRDGFLEELERVRRQGYAFTNEEAVMGVRSFAAPVLSPDGTAIAAVASALPAQALPLRLVPAHARAVVACAEAVSRSLFAGSHDGGSASGPAPKSIGRGRRARPAGRSTRKNRRKDGES